MTLLQRTLPNNTVTKSLCPLAEAEISEGTKMLCQRRKYDIKPGGEIRAISFFPSVTHRKEKGSQVKLA